MSSDLARGLGGKVKIPNGAFPTDSAILRP